MSVTTASVVSSSKAAARIRAAAIEAFAEHGYGGTTTRDIAARLGLSAAAMYPHYKSKEELLFVIAYEGHQKTVEWLQAADPVSESPANRLRAVVAEFARTQAAYHGRSRVVEYELTALSPEHYQVIRQAAPQTDAACPGDRGSRRRRRVFRGAGRRGRHPCHRVTVCRRLPVVPGRALRRSRSSGQAPLRIGASPRQRDHRIGPTT